jgi:hypothetical protein
LTIGHCLPAPVSVSCLCDSSPQPEKRSCPRGFHIRWGPRPSLRPLTRFRTSRTPRFGLIGAMITGHPAGARNSRVVGLLRCWKSAPLSGEPVLRVYSVPSEYSLVAREHLLAELPRVRRQLLARVRAAKSTRITVTLNLSQSEAAANPQGRANLGQPVRSTTKRRSAAASSGRSP